MTSLTILRRWSLPAILLPCILALVAPGSVARAGTCPEGNLLERDGVTVDGPAGSERILRPDAFVPEGTPIDGSIPPLHGPVTVRLDDTYALVALLVQGTTTSAFDIEASDDGSAWRVVARVQPQAGDGLRSRAIRLPEPVTTHWLRVTGDDVTPATLSALAAWCALPQRPEEAARERIEERRQRQALTRHLRLALAVGGMLVLLVSAAIRRRLTDRGRRVLDGTLVALGLLSLAAWSNFGQMHFGRHLHYNDHFHYYLGAKYYPELRHTHLYTCATAVDLEDGLRSRVNERRIRDMRSNRLVSAAGLAQEIDACRARFSPERWQLFRKDVGALRAQMPPPEWERVFRDHGYNAPPTWGLVGAVLAGLAPATPATLTALAWIDPLLLLAMWLLVVWAFGPRTASVAALWWGTNEIAGFTWIGGAFLRQDWLLLLVAGICLVRRGRPGLGGFALTWATLLRVFPGFVVAALVLRAATRTVVERRVAPEYWRFAIGSVAALGLLVPLTLIAGGGVEAWEAFIDNSRANMRSTGSNMVGLMSALSYEHEKTWARMFDRTLENPEEPWLEAKRDVFQRRRPLYWVLAGAFCILMWRAVRREPDWAALALGIGLIPILSFVASYYYSVLLGLAFLRERRGDTVGVALCALSVVSHLARLAFPDPALLDQRYALNSAAVVLLVTALTAWFALSPSRDTPGARPDDQ